MVWTQLTVVYSMHHSLVWFGKPATVYEWEMQQWEPDFFFWCHRKNPLLPLLLKIPAKKWLLNSQQSDYAPSGYWITKGNLSLKSKEWEETWKLLCKKGKVGTKIKKIFLDVCLLQLGYQWLNFWPKFKRHELDVGKLIPLPCGPCEYYLFFNILLYSLFFLP